MNPRRKQVLISAIASAIGGALGAVSGSRSWVVVAVVSAAFGAIAAWSIWGLTK